MDLSVVSATYNRAELLDNALNTYSKQVFPKNFKWEYIIIDDMSTDNTKDIVDKWSLRIPIKYMTSEEIGLPKDPGKWRDGCALVNRGTTFATGDFLILTHPEIMLTKDALYSMYKKGMECPLTERWWVTAIPYWLPPGELPKGWKTDVDKLRNMHGFYDPTWPSPVHSPGTIDYRNNNQEVRTGWESWVFNGIKREDWFWLGGFREFEVWGSVDVDQMNRRAAAKVPVVFATSEHSTHDHKYLMVFHQNHDSQRDMKKTMAALAGINYGNAQEAREVGGLYNYYLLKDMKTRVDNVLNCPREKLLDQKHLEQLICEFGLHTDILHPYSKDQEKYIDPKFGIWQRPEQLASYLISLADKKIGSYLEVGIGNGATLLFTTAFLKTIDPENFRFSLGLDPNIKKGWERMWLYLPIKTAPYTSDDIIDNFDLILIDGDHSYEGVMRDWNNLKDKGKHIAFHDIDANVLPDVKKAWKEVSEGKKIQEFVGPPGVMGIGMILGDS